MNPKNPKNLKNPENQKNLEYLLIKFVNLYETMSLEVFDEDKEYFLKNHLDKVVKAIEKLKIFYIHEMVNVFASSYFSFIFNCFCKNNDSFRKVYLIKRCLLSNRVDKVNPDDIDNLDQIAFELFEKKYIDCEKVDYDFSDIKLSYCDNEEENKEDLLARLGLLLE